MVDVPSVPFVYSLSSRICASLGGVLVMSWVRPCHRTKQEAHPEDLAFRSSRISEGGVHPPARNRFWSACLLKPRQTEHRLWWVG